MLSLIIAGVILLIALLHIYWAFGGFWPGRDSQSLAQLVVGGPPGTQVPGILPCLAVALAFIFAALLVATPALGWSLPLPDFALEYGPTTVFAVFLIRGVGGFFDRKLRPSTAHSPFATLNLRFYSPLCLVIGIVGFLTMPPF